MDGFSTYLVIFGGLMLAGVTGLIIWNSIQERQTKREEEEDFTNDEQP